MSFMKENMLDVLFYLFDNYPEVEGREEENRDSLNAYLQDAGFHTGEIDRAFDWLESLGDEANTVTPTFHTNTFRVFSAYEQRWLDHECQNHLLFLEQAGVLSPAAREQVIDRVLELQDDNFDLDKLKWVTLMVLVNRPNENNSHFWADGMTGNGEVPTYH